jgi:hypothetical protein
VSEPIPYATPERRGLTGRDLFGVVVRTAGLLMVVWGIYTIVYLFNIISLRARTDGQPPGTFLIVGALWGVLGLALLRGEWLVRFAYGPERD